MTGCIFVLVNHTIYIIHHGHGSLALYIFCYLFNLQSSTFFCKVKLEFVNKHCSVQHKCKKNGGCQRIPTFTGRRPTLCQKMLMASRQKTAEKKSFVLGKSLILADNAWCSLTYQLCLVFSPHRLVSAQLDRWKTWKKLPCREWVEHAVPRSGNTAIVV